MKRFKACIYNPHNGRLSYYTYFDSYEEAKNKVQEWLRIELDSDCNDEARGYCKPVVDGDIVTWEEFDKLERVDDYSVLIPEELDSFIVDGILYRVEEEAEG